MPPEDQVAIVRAIAYSDLPDWKDLMLKFVERMPARKTLIDRFVFGKQPTLSRWRSTPAPRRSTRCGASTSPPARTDPILRIVSVLAWAKDQNNVERLTIGSMAKLSLATNASRDKELLDMLKGSMNRDGKETRVVLQEVIDAAETFEFARVRKDAMAAIDQLKTKGPASARNTPVVGHGGPDGAGARLRRRQRHGPGPGRHTLRGRRGAVRRRAQVHDAAVAPAIVQSRRQSRCWRLI